METAHSKEYDSGNAKCWLVRNEQGRRFGPADFATLQEWARDGRIGPLNELSCDGSRWLLASDMPEMQMDWVAAMAPGSFYGPIHAGAMRGLLDDGSVKAGAALFRRDSLDAAGGRQAAEEELESLRVTVGRLRDLNDEQEQQLRQARERMDAGAAEIAALRRQVLDATEKGRLEIAREQERARRQAEKSAAETAEIRRLMREQVEQALERHRLDAARAAALEDDLGRARGELSAVMARSEKLQKDFDNQCRLRAEERGVYEKRVAAALEDAGDALAREKDLRGRILALEQALSSAVADSDADDGASGDAEACASVAGADGREAEYVDAEPLDDDANKPKRAARTGKVIEVADVLPPEKSDQKKFGKHVFGPDAVRSAIPATGLSMAALEAQARRELEILGTGAQMFFSKNRK
ncbi:MAG: hypothetical protein PHE10_05330 [Kiritimatiellae bacterium]|nr:hypothetical protein [Kiritimatiellia bacterium]